jgi:hypothetical protein
LFENGYRRGPFREALAAAPLLVVLALAPVAAARPLTTAPAARSYIRVVITQRSMVVSAASAARGAWVIFHVANRGTSTAKVSFLGKVSAPIAPNHVGSLAVFATRRGTFPIVTSSSGHRRLRTFIVY